MSLTKKIEDYLPYYIGQDIQIPPKEEGAKFDVMQLTYEKFKYDLSNVKLYLRPLSSMAEEEAKEVIKRQFRSWVKPIYEGHSSLCIDVKFQSEGFNKFTYTQIDYDRISPDSVHYLLKQGFDLFGLIEAGMAVDKSKGGDKWQ